MGWGLRSAGSYELHHTQVTWLCDQLVRTTELPAAGLLSAVVTNVRVRFRSYDEFGAGVRLELKPVWASISLDAGVALIQSVKIGRESEVHPRPAHPSPVQV